MHKFKPGDRVVYTNDFGVCWGVKTITKCDTRTYDLWGESYTKPVYHYEGQDAWWFGVDEDRFILADEMDLAYEGDDIYFQSRYGFQPTLEQLGGCY